MNSTQLRSFFYGTLLGDSYIHQNSFYCKQISKDLINFKAKIIKNFLPDASVSISEHEAYIDKNGVSHQKFYLLSANKSEYIKKLSKMFYPNGKKICPRGVIEKLDSLGMAMWFADDGTSILVQYNPTTGSAKNRRVQICTDNFSLQEHKQIIIPELKQKGYEVTYVERDNHFRLTFKNMLKVQKMIIEMEPYFYNYFPSLLYKMDLGYRNTSLLNRRYVLKEYQDIYIKMSAHPSFIDRLEGRYSPDHNNE